MCGDPSQSRGISASDGRVLGQTLPKRRLYGNVALSHPPGDIASRSHIGFYCRHPVTGPTQGHTDRLVPNLADVDFREAQVLERVHTSGDACGHWAMARGRPLPVGVLGFP
jgi:hypothetical protein